MGILDEAIREHLELKRQHGADDSELKELEDDAFGPAERPGASEPDASAEAPTEFMSQPETVPEGDGGGDVEAEVSEPPPRREPVGGLVDLQEAPPGKPEAEADEELEDEGPAEEEQPAAEHEAVPPVSSGPNTEERHIIADQPTQMFDVEGEFESEESPLPTEEAAPPDEDLVAEEIAEPRLAPAEPIHDLEPAIEDAPEREPAVEEEEDEHEDDFFSEQRLSDELDQALEAPIEEEEPESAEHDVVERTDEHEVVAEADSEQGSDKDHDALEETPDFLEEAPEDDRLWFEQKPPKDFDFDD
jgi:hypothetical protein